MIQLTTTQLAAYVSVVIAYVVVSLIGYVVMAAVHYFAG